MAGNTWPKDDWINVVDPETWPDTDAANFIKQLVVTMDVFQWIYSFATEVVEAIPHHPPKHTRPVVGAMGFNANGTNITVPMTLGYVGYNAVNRKVQWQVNEYGGFQKSEAEFDISMMLPIIMQLTLMFPWNFQGELNKEFGKSGQALGQEVYEFIRTAMRGIDVTLPTFGIGDPNAWVTKRHITIKSKSYTFTHGDFTYTFTVPKDSGGNDIVLSPDAAITVSIESVEAGKDTITEGEIITVDFELGTGQSAEASIGKIQNNSVNNKATLVIRNASREQNWLNNLLKPIASSIPVMDITQRLYDAAKTMVEAIYHHPPAFTKTVWAGGVTVSYKYYVHNTWEAKELGVSYTSIPTPATLSGKTLTVTANFESKILDESSGIVARKPHGEYILLTHTFNSWETVIQYVENDTTFNDYRGAEQSTAIVFVTAQNSSSDTVPLRAGTYEATFSGKDFVCVLGFTNVLSAGLGTIMRFEAKEAGEVKVDAASATVTMTYGELDPALSFSVYDNYNTAGKVGRTGRICTNPYERVEIAKGDVVKPHTGFFATQIPATWIVENVSHGTDYIAPIPATPVYDDGGVIKYDTDGAALLKPDGAEEKLASRCRINIKIGTDASPVFENATSYTPGDAFQMLKSINTSKSVDGSLEFCLVAKDNQVTDVRAGDSFTLTCSSGELTGYVSSVTTSGKAGLAPNVAKIGSSLGDPAVLSIILVNETDTSIDLSEFMRVYKTEVLETDNYPVDIGGELFTLTNIEKASGILAAGSGSASNSLRFNVENASSIVFDKEVIDADVSFASTMLLSSIPNAVKEILRWSKDKDLVYIGNTLSLGTGVEWAYEGKQSLLCRLRYRLQERTGRKEAFYHYVYTGDETSNDYVKVFGADHRVPSGTMPIAVLSYNAKEKSISVQNLLGGGIVKMRVNACLSFMIQHLLLLPVQVT